MKKKIYNQKYFKERDYLDPKIASVVENFAKDKNSKIILDVGCGTGKLVNYLNKQGFKVFGCDPYCEATKVVNRGSQKSNFFIKASATNLPFENNYFDLIIAVSVIEHLTRLEFIKFLLEAKRLLKDQGWIFLVTPNYNSIWRKILGKKWFGYSDPTHINFYTPQTLVKLLSKTNFENHKLSFKVKGLTFIDYVLVSTPLWRLRDSFYIAAQK